MRRAALVALCCALQLVAAASARAQSGITDIVVELPAGVSPDAVTQTRLRVAISGSVAVDYQGSVAAGCEARGLCDVSGAATWTPGRDAELDVVRYVQRDRHRLEGMLAVDTSSGTAAVVAVQRGESVCGDARPGASGFANLTSRSGSALSFRLVDYHATDFLSTRCAGPLPSDLVKLLPVRPLPRSALTDKRARTIDLSTVRPFSAGGFAGTLRSTLVARIGPALRERPLPRELRDLVARERSRLQVITSHYRVERVAGTLAVGFQGVADPDVCAGLDSCGASGSMRLDPSGRGGQLAIVAVATRRRTRRDLLTALGLERGGNPKGVFVNGGGFWRSTSGTLSATIARAGGGGCSDAVPFHHGALLAAVDRRGLVLGYWPGSGLDGALRTHCGGPLLDDFPPGTTIVSGRVSRAALRRRTVTVHLGPDRFAQLASPGYSGAVQADVTVTLRRLRVKQTSLLG